MKRHGSTLRQTAPAVAGTPVPASGATSRPGGPPNPGLSCQPGRASGSCPLPRQRGRTPLPICRWPGPAGASLGRPAPEPAAGPHHGHAAPAPRREPDKRGPTRPAPPGASDSARPAQCRRTWAPTMTRSRRLGASGNPPGGPGRPGLNFKLAACHGRTSLAGRYGGSMVGPSPLPVTSLSMRRREPQANPRLCRCQTRCRPSSCLVPRRAPASVPRWQCRPAQPRPRT